MSECQVETCNGPIYAKGWCRQHWNRMRLYGRLDKIRGIEKPICSVEGCSNKSDNKGMCTTHYHRFWQYGRVNKVRTGEIRQHPFYIIWWQRKSNNLLCEAWLDFQTFASGIAPKPEGNYFLLQIDGSKPFGPDNFRWLEHLKRKKDESKTDWWARKRAARIAANPAMESDRNIKRKYDLTREQYNEKLTNQNFGCAVCGEKETSFDGRTGSFRNLAVDHCHKHKGIRELLCWRCNGTLGKVNDDVNLLQKMIDYLKKHGE